jgi:xanthine/CO dehydrogenase XdhC/CoxF family maturation factor
MLPVGMHANSWLTKALASLDDGQDIVLVTVTATKGSSPRNRGSQMLVTKAGIWQTIGGGALEFDVMARARKMLARDDDDWQRQHMTVILGPDMGQCCGGQMSLLLEKFTAKQAGALAALAQQDHHNHMLAHPLESGVPLRLQSALASFDEAVFIAPPCRGKCRYSSMARVMLAVLLSRGLTGLGLTFFWLILRLPDLLMTLVIMCKNCLPRRPKKLRILPHKARFIW